MYVVIEHDISNPNAFWGKAEKLLPALPPSFHLVHTFPRADGAKAVCVWDAPSSDRLRAFIESQLGAVSRNEYFEVSNREGIAMPEAVDAAGARH